jgi:hypothetical protein
MNDPKVSAKSGSVAIGGDVNASITNINAEVINLEIFQESEFSSLLGDVIVQFAQHSSAQYKDTSRGPVRPEVIVKINHNNLTPKHRLLSDWTRYGNLLEECYLGVEQENPNVRLLVRRTASVAYESLLTGVKEADRIEYVRANATGLVNQVVDLLLQEYKKSTEVKVKQEIAHLAVSLVVADAVIECDVLERPENAVAA